MRRPMASSGTALFLGGSAGILAVSLAGPLGWDAAGRLFATATPLWYGLFLSFAAMGAWRLWFADHGNTHWRPSQRGQRFQTAVLYTRKDCPLCDDAKAMLERYSPYLPATSEVDVDQDPELLEQFDLWVPVVALDGKVRFKGRIDELLLRRLIEGTPPIG
jgi:glutaredoxin